MSASTEHISPAFDLEPPNRDQFEALASDLNEEERDVLLDHDTEAPFCGLIVPPVLSVPRPMMLTDRSRRARLAHMPRERSTRRWPPPRSRPTSAICNSRSSALWSARGARSADHAGQLLPARHGFSGSLIASSRSSYRPAPCG